MQVTKQQAQVMDSKFSTIKVTFSGVKLSVDYRSQSGVELLDINASSCIKSILSDKQASQLSNLVHDQQDHIDHNYKGVTLDVDFHLTDEDWIEGQRIAPAVELDTVIATTCIYDLLSDKQVMRLADLVTDSINTQRKAA